VIKGDVEAIRIGDNVSIGEGSVLSPTMNMPKGISNGVNIADNVIIGANSVLHACTIDSYVRIGSSVQVQPGARIERGAIILDGATVGNNYQVPALTVWAGNPARYIRDVTPEDYTDLIQGALADQTKQAAATTKYMANLNIKS
jgi:carbonic anhydrase/acetyltransferase-like protein (isoleucine patch superfamily)